MRTSLTLGYWCSCARFFDLRPDRRGGLGNADRSWFGERPQPLHVLNSIDPSYCVISPHHGHSLSRVLWGEKGESEIEFPLTTGEYYLWFKIATTSASLFNSCLRTFSQTETLLLQANKAKHFAS